MNTLLFQLADSGFPSGTFAHSFGLESLRQAGQLHGEPALEQRLIELIWNTAYGVVPFLNEAFGRSASVPSPVASRHPLPSGEGVDRALDAFLSSAIANSASRAQGQAFLLAAQAAFEHARIGELRDELPFGHSAVAAGAALARAGVALADAREVFLFGSVRAALSAAVRLGVIGPLRAQAVLARLHPVMAKALERTQALCIADARNVSPLLELTQSAHGRLYSRLFQS